MKYTLLYDNPDESLITRLFKIRSISDQQETFLNPTFSHYRQPREQLSDIHKALPRIVDAIQRQEKIMIFGDYDVDGIMSTYVMYTFFKDFLGYANISLRIPHKLHDGYGMKMHHIDEIATTGTRLIITVDNGISAIKEVAYAKSLGMDVIITDHHQAPPEIPDAIAVVNPQTSPQMQFKEICGAAVAFKVCLALADTILENRQLKKALFTKLLPFVSIATVADCMPLINENRLLVKKGLEIMNTERRNLAPGLQLMLDHLNITTVDTFHIGFMIAPRLNATGRMDNAIEGLKSLLFTDPILIQQQLDYMDELNTRRKQRQDEMFKHVLQTLDSTQAILIAADETYHEGIIGIVAGKITEKHNKPSLILGIDKEKGYATGSLRGPGYFNIVEMLHTAAPLLERYGGHAQAGGLTVKLENIEPLREILYAYCMETIRAEDMEKEVLIDTKVYDHEISHDTISSISDFGPFGEGNREPQLLFEDITILDSEVVGKNGTKHLKLHASKGGHDFTVMHRRKGDTCGDLVSGSTISLVGKIKKDTYKGGIFVDVTSLVGLETDEESDTDIE